MATQRLTSPEHDEVILHETPNEPDAVHLFDARSMLAINAALVANRPLLVRGEPGVGKSQLARAASKALGRQFIQRTLTIRTEAQDLFWMRDDVRRLAEAQLLSAVFREQTLTPSILEQTLEDRLAVDRFVEPGPLWWAFDWVGARDQLLRARPKLPEGNQPPSDAPRGVVVLLDEIDKADGSVPNGLLEALGQRSFLGPSEEALIRQRGITPLIIVTTNEERALPNAFLRRCLVLHLALPDNESALKELLIERGRAHFRQDPVPSDQVLEQAADFLVKHRQKVKAPPRPGQAEYFDLLRAVCLLAEDEKTRLALLTDVGPLTLGKFQARAKAFELTR